MHTEADLNASGTEATGALGATWASWAVTSLTSKFYRSKSTSQPPDDTKDVKSPAEVPMPQAAEKEPASKQGSEESDVWGAMETLDEERKEGAATDGWQEDWDADVLEEPTPSPQPQTQQEKNGWDTEDWGSSGGTVERKKKEEGEKWPTGKRKPMRLGAQRVSVKDA